MKRKQRLSWLRRFGRMLCRVGHWTASQVKGVLRVCAEVWYGVVVCHVPRDAQCIIIYADGEEGVRKATKLAKAIDESGALHVSIIVADSTITVARLSDAPENIKEAMRKELAI